jgi:hypothetical protein
MAYTFLCITCYVFFHWFEKLIVEIEWYEHVVICIICVDGAAGSGEA